MKLPPFPPGRSYDDYYSSLPPEKNNTNDFDLFTAYWSFPPSELEKFRDDPGAHLPSVAPDLFHPDLLKILKSKNHPSYGEEISWYYSDTPDAYSFRQDYDLDESSDPQWSYYTPHFPSLLDLTPYGWGRKLGTALSGPGGPVERIWNHFHPSPPPPSPFPSGSDLDSAYNNMGSFDITNYYPKPSR